CRRGESNPYALRHRILSPARLPIPPLLRGLSPIRRIAWGEVKPCSQSLARACCEHQTQSKILSKRAIIQRTGTGNAPLLETAAWRASMSASQKPEKNE